MRRTLPFLAASVLLAGCGGAKQSTPTITVQQASSGAESLQATYERVVRTVSPQVVLIQQPAGLGSGIVFDGNGDIVTNAHVVGTAKKVTVTVSGGKTYPGKVVGTFVPDDLAVVRISGSKTPAASFADSNKLAVGEIVLAIGNPLGLTSSVTDGIISALDRTQTEDTGATLAHTIQTSAPINPGNSGGALVDLNNRVVGMNTLAAGSPFGGAAPGIGFAIPSNTIKDIAGQIVEHGKVVNSHKPFLGITAATLPTGAGVLVTKVLPGGGAAKAGIRPGDVITAIDGKPTPSLDDLAQVLASHKPGDTVKVTVTGRRKATLTVKLGELPAG
ncbi:MAG: trypsin-like peptidase domain-containing protein [Gaiellaceae bacterium]